MVTKNEDMREINDTGAATNRPTFSGFLSAMDLGTSSPMIREKYEMMRTAIPIEIASAPGSPSPSRLSGPSREAGPARTAT
jgi:hypothetical protein